MLTIKRQIKKKLVKLGRIQYLLYKLSLVIGRIRTICFYKDGNQNISAIICGGLITIGVLFTILPFRTLYVIIVFVVFYIISVVLPINLSIFLSATSLLRFIRKSGDGVVFVSSALFLVSICSSLDGFEGPWDI